LDRRFDTVKRKTAIITLSILFATASAPAIFGDWEAPDDKADNLNEDQGIDTSQIQLGTSWLSEAKATEANQQNLIKKEPIPKMENSLERENLRRRYQTLNDRDKVFHVYLMSYGKVVSYFTAKGKVSSVNSKLTQPEQIVQDTGRSGHGEQNDHVVSSPQLDGSYGTNGDGVFFYTTDGSYVEWNGEYMVSERPLNIQTPVALEKDVE